ncbi:dephospho-CoA kinase [Methylomonas sp. MgM2]
MFKVGLTGGIGCGKSTVSQLFADIGVPIIDADVIARQLVEPGRYALEKLAMKFGSTILNADGSLNRKELRFRAFSNPKIKQQLDEIMHPLIYDEIQAQAAQLRSPYCIIVIPLLLETQKRYTVDRVLVVDCPLEIQLQRVLERDDIDQAQAQAIIAAQVGRQQRLANADDVIDNSEHRANLAEQVKSLHNLYLLLATDRTTSV